MKPKILFLVSQPFFQWRGSPIRVGFDLLALTELGYEVDLITLPVGEDRSIPGMNHFRAPNLLGIKNVPIGPSLAKALFDIIIFFQAFSLCQKNRYTAIHCVEDMGPFGVILSFIFRTRLVYEKHSDPGSHKKGFLKNLILSVYALAEKFTIHHADAVIGTGDGLAAQIKTLSPKGPVYSIFDIPSSLQEADPIATEKKRNDLLKHPNEILATYVGSFASYQGIDLLFEAIPLALEQNPKLRFVIIGGTPEEIKTRLAGLKEKRFQDQVTFPGKTPPDLLPNALSASDILLSPRLSGVNTPLKLLDYLKAGRAILAADTEANRLILNDSTALLSPPTAQDYAKGLLQLSQDKALREKISSQGRKLIDSTYNFPNFKSLLQNLYGKM